VIAKIHRRSLDRDASFLLVIHFSSLFGVLALGRYRVQSICTDR